MIDYNTPVFYNDGYDDYGGDTRRTEHHLTQALNNISNIFEVRIVLSCRPHRKCLTFVFLFVLLYCFFTLVQKKKKEREKTYRN